MSQRETRAGPVQGSIPQFPGKCSGSPWVLEESQDLGLQPENLAMLACLVLVIGFVGFIWGRILKGSPDGRPLPALRASSVLVTCSTALIFLALHSLLQLTH